MKKAFQVRQTLIIIIILMYYGCKSSKKQSQDGVIEIQYVDKLSGDFSFVDEWSYPIGVYKNEFGQLSCDGFCPPEIDAMKDKSGKIIEDSLNVFYKFIDTTHQQHTLKCEAWCYEWEGTDFIEARRINKDTIECFTLANAATHSILHFYIAGKSCFPTIELNSISSPNKPKKFHVVDGFIKVDQTFLRNGIFKADFDLIFDHKENTKQKMFWKGKAYTKVLSSDK